MVLMNDSSNITQLLRNVRSDDPAGVGVLFEAVYGDLKRAAGGLFANERAGHSLSPTALVHEAYLRLVDWRNVEWRERAQFFAIATKVMRRILVDHARMRLAEKRGAGIEKTVIEEIPDFAVADPRDVVAVHEALTELEKLDERKARIVELRYFGGFEIEETAELTGISPATVKREWAFARAWLQRYLTGE
jgi:RNA polymerase sigma factor (TIGR02999 family)